MSIPARSALRLAIVASLLLAPAARASVNDDCATPDDLGSALGTFGWNGVGNTTGTQGQNEPLCFSNGSSTMRRDVWFRWQAPTTDSFRIYADCTSDPSFDARIAVYLGAGCPLAPALACSDDVCGVAPELRIAGVAGAVYAIQVAEDPSAPFSFGGAFTIARETVACAAIAGPDALVTTFDECVNYAALGGFDAISLGFRVANVGSAPLDWDPASSAHPVFVQNLYRYHLVHGVGRLDHVGQSFAYHPGPLASPIAGACDCTRSGSTASLGVGCSERIAAASFADQTRLAPRSDVDPASRTFAFPPSNPPYSGDFARRLRFSTSEVFLGSGSLFFGEVVAVVPGDATPSAANASYLQLSLQPTATDFSVITTSVRAGVAAIHAWQELDPAVRIETVSIPGDGIVLVASRATATSSGLTHYQYAIQNVSSARAIGSFSIPIPSGVFPQNAQFHDVAYEAGDGPGGVAWSGVDWTFEHVAGRATWRTEAQAVDPRANAVRWGTLYGFGFDANAQPAAASADLGIWSAGSPATITATLDVPGAPVDEYTLCWGFGPTSTCPCGGDPSDSQLRSCRHSLGYGARALASGTASVANDTLRFDVQQVPLSTSCVLIQGSALENGGTGSVFGDGLRCFAGTLVRCGSRSATFGSLSFPAPGPSISVLGGVAPGDARVYQVMYRNAATFCTPDAFNLTNATRLVWAP